MAETNIMVTSLHHPKNQRKVELHFCDIVCGILIVNSDFFRSCFYCWCSQGSITFFLPPPLKLCSV